MITLTELIASEPANAARSDAQVLAWLTASVDTFVDVSWLDLSMWIAENDLRKTIASRVGGTDAAVSTAAQHIVDCIAAGQPLAASDARVRTTIAKAMPAGAARNALLALATKSVKRWELSKPITLNGRWLRDGPGLSHVTEARQ